MGGLTRRTFLARASVAAAAVTGGGAALAGLATSAIPAVTAAPSVAGATRTRGELLVAHVRNISSGEVAVLMGTREVVYRDRALVSRLLDAVR